MSRVKTVLLGVSLLVLSGMAFALDANDISQMVRNGVQDSVIINVVQTQKLNRPLTAQEVLLLNTNGASPTLLEYLTRSEAVSGSYVATSPAPTIVTGSNDVTYAAPSITVSPPAPTVVTQPYPPTTTYIIPDYIYTTPTYVYPYPYTYVYPYAYEYPYYRYQPNSSFNFFFGGRRK